MLPIMTYNSGTVCKTSLNAAYPLSENAVPKSNGPNVMMVQYKVILVVKRRGRVTLKIKLKLFSIVDNSKIAVKAIPTTPIVVSLAVALIN